MGITPAERMNHIGQETAFEVLVRARALEATGRSVVHLEIGEPDFDTPGHIIAAAQQALEGGFTHYGPGAGLPEPRLAVARYLRTWRGLDVDAGRVIITPGGKPVMFFAILALVNPGDEVIYPNPGFPIYESMVTFVGGQAVPMPLREERRFRFDPDEFRSLVTHRTRLIIINSPHNPTGSVLTRGDLQTIADVARERDIVVLSDEIYSRILYTGQHESIAAFPGMLDRTILLDGWSKTWAMTGWRPAFYAFPNITGTGFSSRELADTLLEEAGVACLAGTAFGSYGEGFIRFSYANPLDNIHLALERMRGLLESRSSAD